MPSRGIANCFAWDEDWFQLVEDRMMAQEDNAYRGKNILVIDDDVTLLKVLKASLEKDGFVVSVAADGTEGLRLTYAHHPDLVILDIMMPQMDGWEVCARLREMTDVPILMLTALGSDSDAVKGLRLGADDYLRKPFSGDELTARVEAILRRADTLGRYDSSAAYDDGVLRIDFDGRQVYRRGELVALTPREYSLLACMASSPQQVLSHRDLLAHAWGPRYIGATHYLSLYIRYLRQKLEDDPADPQYIRTRWGMGYFFNPRDSSQEP
jgi:two-component system KDP operon response regulator KdpE